MLAADEGVGPLQNTHAYRWSTAVHSVFLHTQLTNVGSGNDHVGGHNLNVAVAVELLAVLDGLQGCRDDPLVVLGVEHAVTLRQGNINNLLLHTGKEWGREKGQGESRG